MKGSLTELIEDSTLTYALAQSRMSHNAQQVAELEAAGVSRSRIEALYPFSIEDFEQAVERAVTALRDQLTIQVDGTDPLLRQLLAFQLSAAYEHLPDSIVDAAHDHYDEGRLAQSKLAVLLHLFHSLATYNPSAEVLYGESETEAENAWTDALHELEPAAELLRSICYAV